MSAKSRAYKRTSLAHFNQLSDCTARQGAMLNPYQISVLTKYAHMLTILHKRNVHAV